MQLKFSTEIAGGSDEYDAVDGVAEESCGAVTCKDVDVDDGVDVDDVAVVVIVVIKYDLLESDEGVPIFGSTDFVLDVIDVLCSTMKASVVDDRRIDSSRS